MLYRIKMMSVMSVIRAVGLSAEDNVKKSKEDLEMWRILLYYTIFDGAAASGCGYLQMS